MKIRTILFPTDFSVNAENAMEYAVQLADRYKASLLLFHSFHMPVIRTDVPLEEMEKQVDLAEKEAKKKLQQMQQSIQKKFPDLSSMIVVRRGFTVENIINLLDEQYIDMIVMGTKGASGIKEIVLGSITGDVIAKAECPVLAIPEDAKYRPFKNMAYAVDHNNPDCEPLSYLVKLALSFDAEAKLVSVLEDGDIQNDKIKEELKSKVAEQVNYASIKVEIVSDKDVLHGINKYVEENHPDLLVMATRKKSLLDKLFKGSLTKKMAFHTHLPLLALHSS
ncbi:universal stress protein [Cytophagaceae bacterium ABcell3]|nr:universal stress protein [Cytophagaceae bacterium ABcell3]